MEEADKRTHRQISQAVKTSSRGYPPAWLLISAYALVGLAAAALVVRSGWNVNVLTVLLPVCIWVPFVYARPVSYALVMILSGFVVAAGLLSPPGLSPTPVSFATGILLTVALIEIIYRMLAQRRGMERQLAAALGRQQVLFEGASDAILLESLEGRILDANRRACELYGYTRQEFLQLTVRDIVAPEYYHLIATSTKDFQQPFESVNVAKNGRQFPVEISGSQILLEGEPHWLVMVRDIGQRTQFAALLELQNRVTLEVSSASSLESASPRLLTAARSLPGIDISALYLFERESGRFQIYESQGLPRRTGPLMLDMIDLDTAFGQVVQLGLPRYYRMEEVFPDPVDYARRALGITAGGVVPIFFQKDIVAALIVASTSERELPVVTCSALETITYVAGTVMARLQAEERLRASEARFRHTFESATIGLYQTSLRGELISANEALANMLGFDSLPALMARYGQDVRQVYVDPTLRDQLLLRLQAGEQSLRTETRMHHADGSQIDVLIGIWGVNGEQGETAYLEGFIEDITERRNLLRRMELLHTIDQVLLSAKVLEERLPEILEKVYELAPFDQLEVWSSISGKDETYLHMVFEPGPRGMELRRVGREALEPLFPLPLEHVQRIEDLQALPQVGPRVEQWLEAGMRACLNARMALQDHLYGRFTLLAREPGAFSEIESAFVDQLAHMFALGLQDRRLRLSEKRARQQAEARAQRIDLLRRSAVAMNETSYVRDVAERGLVYIMEAARAEVGWMVLENPQTGQGELASQVGLETAANAAANAAASAGAALPCLTCLGQQPECQAAVHREDGRVAYWHCESLERLTGVPPISAGMLLVPVHNGARQVGVVKVLAPAGFQPEDELEQVLLAIASQISAGLDRVELFERVNQLAIHDSLTGLYNRRYFFDRADYEFRRSRRYGTKMSLMMIDLDHFKRVNDQYGHPVGDEVLKQVARSLEASLRNTDLLARYGGEEFIILLAETDRSTAEVAARRTLQMVRERAFKVPGGSLQLTISVGLATLDDEVPNVSALIERADRGLYQAKSASRDTLVVV